MKIRIEIGGFEKEYNSIPEAHEALEKYSAEKAEAIERAERFNKLLRERCREWSICDGDSDRLAWSPMFNDNGTRKSESQWIKERQEKTANNIIGAVRKLIRVRMGAKPNSNLEILIKEDIEGTCFSILDDILPPISDRGCGMIDDNERSK